MTLKEIIYSIREDFKLMSDDNDLTQEYLAYLIKNARSIVMQQRYSDPRNIIPSIEYQSFTAVIGNDAKSTTAVPSVIKTTGNAHSPVKIYAQGIADTIIKVPVNVVSVERLPFVGSNHFTNDQIYCAIDEDGIILFNSKNNLYKLINSVKVRGIFEDPAAAYALTGRVTDFYDTKYPVSDSVLLDVRKIVDARMASIVNSTKDNLSDATEERLEQNPQGNK